MNKFCYLIFTFFLFVIQCKAEWAEKVLSKLSLEEKIAQLFIIGANNSDFTKQNLETNQNQIINPNEKGNIFSKANVEFLIKNYKVGGVHFIYNGTIESAFNSINYLQSLSEIPLLITQDFEWGLSMRLTDAIRFPRNMTLGAIENNDLIYELGKEIGRQCKLLGVHINFAPVVDINNNPANPVIADRSFGEDKENVATKAIYFMRGLQDAGILACAKHFCGHGDTDVDSHLDLPVIKHSLDRLHKIELYSFKKVINAGIKSIMSAHIHVPAIDARSNRSITLSQKAMTEILQKELNFSGLIITDALNMKGITKYFAPGQADLEAFLAGNDILLMSEDVPRAISLIKNAIEENKITIEELDRRVLKVLKTKEQLNLNKQKSNLQFNYNDFILPHSKVLKQKLYESAITLVKNDEKIIANAELKNNKICLVIIGDQPMKYENFNNQIRQYSNVNCTYINKNNTNELNNFLKSTNSYDVLIIGLFDLNKFKNQNYGISQEILNFLNKLNDQEKKIILTIFGNPYSLKFFNNFKNIIIAYENDEEAQNATAKIIFDKLNTVGGLPISIN